MTSKHPIQIDIGARAEAKLQIKAQVPAKSAGRLLDALTDVIRPFTEARGLRADQIRLQREEVAIKIAQKASERMAILKSKPQPVPTKILVPLLERSSLEDPEDQEMIERWANLLASAAGGSTVEPRYVSILGELSGKQARILREVVVYRCEEVKNPTRSYEDNYLSRDASHFLADFLANFENRPTLSIREIEKYLLESLNVPGSIADVAYIDFPDGRYPLGVQFHDDLDFESIEICMSLGLIAREVARLDRYFTESNGRKTRGILNVVYFRITLLGNALMELCDPVAMSKINYL